MTQPAAYNPITNYSEELDTTQVPGNHGAHLDQERCDQTALQRACARGSSARSYTKE